jgi:hypothetical protein
VNEELEHRNLQLSRANDDLGNLLRAVNVPTIMVGRDLRIRRFTPGSERVMNLIATDVGRPITDIALRVSVPDLGELLTHVIENIGMAERELCDETGHWYSMRIRPYQTDDNRIEGAVITLVDVDELRGTLARVTQASRLSDGMNSVLSALLSEQDRETVMRALLEQGSDAVDADTALILLRDEDGWVVRDPPGSRVDATGTHVGDDAVPQATMAATTKAPVAVQSGEGSSSLLPSGFGAAAFVVAPLIMRTKVHGVVFLAWQKPKQAPDEAQIDFVAKLGALVALALWQP